MTAPLTDSEKRAYRLILYYALLWERIQLGAAVGREDRQRVLRAYRRAADAYELADWLHNLAEFSANDFLGFDSDRFWGDGERLRRPRVRAFVRSMRRLVDAESAKPYEPVNVGWPESP